MRRAVPGSWMEGGLRPGSQAGTWLTRRAWLGLAAASLAGTATPRSVLGLASTCLAVHKLRDPWEVLELAHSLGAGGVQVPLRFPSLDEARKFHARAEELGMYVEGMASLPRLGDEDTFEHVLEQAAAAGARVLRVACLNGRRYESFRALAAWREFVQSSRRALVQALPLAERRKLVLAIENHKDWTLEELRALMKEYESEFLGVTLDTGNNIALLDDPVELVRELAPYAAATHLKDMAMSECEEGFLLSEVPFGEGILDMKWVIDTVRRARPETRLTVEMITRDPLTVPCLSEQYWVTFPDRPGQLLARTLRLARQHGRSRALPRVSQLSAEEQRARELQNVRQCLEFARKQLSL